MESDWERQRSRMVEDQIAYRGIKDPLTLESMRTVPRHLFVPPENRHNAYADGPLSIGKGQTISQPYIVSLMTQAAELTPECAVLEIGTGSGYAAAVLANIVNEVYTIERIEALARRAKQVYEEIDYNNIHVKVGDGTLGWPEHAPYDAIIVTAGAPVAPQSLLKQLKERGRLIIPEGDAMSQQLVRYRKMPDGKFKQEFLEHVRFVPLIGEEGW